MSIPLAVALGAIVGAALASLGWRLATRGPREEPVEAFDSVPSTLDPAAGEVLKVLRSATAVIGSHDEILHSSELARSLGIVRGTRVHPQILPLVREVRGSSRVRPLELEEPQAPGIPPRLVSVRVAGLSEEKVLILADDRTAAVRIEAIRRDFTTNVSHELKTPIGAISLLSEAVADAAEDPAQVRRFAERMQIESRRLTDLVQQIIQLSRLQADNPLLAAEEVAIDLVIAESMDASRVDAERRNISLTRAGDQGCTVLGDEGQLVIAVSNLVSNAVSYSEPGAKVVVSANRRREPELELIDISVSDNGIGIAADDLERIFERFYRVDYGRSRDHGGTGLGLSIVKHVAMAHGGGVNVWSQLGNGSTFTLRVPAQQPPGETAPADRPEIEETAE